MSRTIRELMAERSADLVGRAAERAALLRVLEDEGPLVVFVHGIAGVGKSTLLEAFAGEAGVRGAIVIRLDCRSIEPTESGLLRQVGTAVGAELGSVAETADALAGLGDRVVLVLDTYEVLRLLDTWLRRVFVPALHENTRVVVAGREPPLAAWYAAPGWSELVHSLQLANLGEREAEQLLARRGVEAAAAHRVNRLARGHPLSLELAAAAVRAQPNVELEEIALQAVLDELTALYLDGLDPESREALDAASVVRRITLSLLAELLPEQTPTDAFARLRALPFVQLEQDGLLVHDTIRETVARSLRGTDPARHRRYRAAAWRTLRREVASAAPAELWRYTADMLYLIEQPVVREAFFPTTEHLYSVEEPTPADGPALEAIVHRHEPRTAAAHLLGWCEQAPEGVRVVRTPEGAVVGLRIMFEPDQVPYGAIEADPVTRSWREHLRREPLPSGQRVLFLRRWLSAEEGELPSSVQAACWLDIKRVYMELRPQLRRLYTTVRDLATWAPIVTPLEFAALPETVEIDDAVYHSALLDFGPGSVDGWLATLAARELLIEDDSLLDAEQHQLVLDGDRVDLTRLEVAVLAYLLQRQGQTVERTAFLRDVWGSSHAGSNVVDAVIRSLRKKLGDRAEMIETVRGLGYRLRLDDHE